MTFKFTALILTALFVPVCTFADFASKHVKLIEYATITGFYKDMESVVEENKKASTKYVHTMVDNFKTNNPNISSLGEARALGVYQEYMLKVSNAMSAEEAVEIWIGLFSPIITEKELDQILSFYKTPVGRKYTNATSMVTPKFTAAMNHAGNEKVKKELVMLNKNINTIIIENQKEKNPSSRSIIERILSIFK